MASSPEPHLLLIDDDPNTFLLRSRVAFRLAGYEATVCDSASRALEFDPRGTLRRDFFGRGDARQRLGISLLEDLKATGVTTPVVMILGPGQRLNLPFAPRGLGAVDFLEKPLSTEKLLVTIENVLRMRHLRKRRTPRPSPASRQA